MLTSISTRPCVVARTGDMRTRPAQRRSLVANATRWELGPEPAWCSANPKKCAELKGNLDLSDALSKNSGATLCSTDDPNCDFDFECSDTGVKVKFTSQGESNPIDSPASLSMEHVSSTETVSVDGKTLEQGESATLHPGSKLTFGDVQYQVLRNVIAHA